MNNTLSINRIGLLFKRFFIQNLRKDIRLVGAAAACSAVMHFLQFPLTMGPLTPVVLFVSLYAAGTIYKLYANRNHGLVYTMLPASTLEKVIVNILLVSVYYVILAFIADFIGAILGRITTYLLDVGLNGFTAAELNFDLSFQNQFGRCLLVLAMFQSIFLFGSIYFRKFAIVKTILVGLGLLFAVILVIFIMATTIMDTTSYYTYTPSFGEFRYLDVIVAACITLFFWGMSYLRLRETEV
jgi:hypothetical protein